MIAVDTNVIACLLIRGERSDAMDRLLAVDKEWVAPRIWIDAVINILCTYERNGLIDSGESLSLLKDALALMDGQSYEVPPERIIGVARRTGCSGYDSQYVALAEDLGAKLYTCAKKVLRTCPEIATLPK